MHEPSLSTSARLLRLGLIALVLAVLTGAFAWTGGWLTPQRLSPQRVAERLEQNAGVHPGYRRAHSPGVCFSGYLESSGALAAYSRAELLQPGRVAVRGRLSIGAGNPHAPDTSVPVRSLSLLLQQADGQQWRMALNTPPVLAVGTPEAFYQQLEAMRPQPATGKPDPARLQAFFAAHPESAAFRAWMAQQVPSDSFASNSFNSINAFLLVNAKGERQAVRWAFVPDVMPQPLAAGAQPADVLQQDLQRRLSEGPLSWHWRFSLAEAGDVVNDASRPWPAERRQIDAGTLVIERATPQLEGDCHGLVFDPLVLPDGVEASADPILRARSAAYAESYRRRTAEGTPHTTGGQP